MNETEILISLITSLTTHLDKSGWHPNGIEQLRKEVMQSEAYLSIENGKLTRNLSVGWCEILNPDRSKKLIELEQRWNHKTINRNQSVAGKLRYTHNTFDEMIREIREELFNNNEIPIDLQYKGSDTTEGDSPKFPGIPAKWKNYYFRWVMPQELVKDKYFEDDGEKFTTFGWVDI